jgi:FtsP/CotA-like multicopper oxidase with cupredoxin domain
MPKQEVGKAQYRLRLYNVSNAKTYDFAFHDNRKFKIVATDGGFLNEPVEVEHILLGAAERVEIIVDFSEDNLGSKVILVSKPFAEDAMMSDMDASMNEMDMEANGMGLTIMRFDVTKEVADEVTLYVKLPANAEIATRLDVNSAINKDNPRKFIMSLFNGTMGNNMNGMGSNNNMNMTFAINGKLFDPNRVDEFITAGTTEIWSIENNSTMAHPFHAHAIQWQIVDRNGVPSFGTDLGWKDTFLVQPNETVRIIGKFEAVNVGDYMYHCHILEHEDQGMMGQFVVV